LRCDRDYENKKPANLVQAAGKFLVEMDLPLAPGSPPAKRILPDTVRSGGSLRRGKS
jgi:hypothetical protein